MTIKVLRQGPNRWRPILHLQFADKAGSSPAVWRGREYGSQKGAHDVAAFQAQQLFAQEKAAPGTLAQLAWDIRLATDDEAELRERIAAAVAFNETFLVTTVDKIRRRRQAKRRLHAAIQRKRALEEQVAAAEHARRLAQEDPDAKFECLAGGMVISRRMTPGSYSERLQRNPF